MLVKNVRLKSMKGTKSKISSPTHRFFLPGEIHINVKEILRSFIIRHFFFHLEVSRNISNFFKRYNPGYSQIVSNANILRLNLSNVTRKCREALEKLEIWLALLHVINYHFYTEIFMKINWCNKMCNSNIAGQSMMNFSI